GRLMTERREVPRVKIGDAEQAAVPCRHLRSIVGRLQVRLPAVEPVEEARVVRVEYEDAHGPSDRNPVTVVLVDPGLVGAAGDVAPPGFMVEIPLHGLCKPAVERDAAVEAEFAGELACVDGVAA